jgi:hypothetical protein
VFSLVVDTRVHGLTGIDSSRRRAGAVNRGRAI